MNFKYSLLFYTNKTVSFTANYFDISNFNEIIGKKGLKKSILELHVVWTLYLYGFLNELVLLIIGIERWLIKSELEHKLCLTKMRLWQIGHRKTRSGMKALETRKQ